MNFQVFLVWFWIGIASWALFNDNSIGCFIAVAISQVWGATNIILGAINGKD